MTDYVTIEEVRLYLRDRTASDNPLLLDLAFTDDEIKGAMRSAAREFNSLPPDVFTVSPDRLPARTNMFFDGIVASLLRAEMLRRSRNEVRHQAGNVTIDTDSVLIAHLQRLIPEHQRRFEIAAREFKRARNIQGFYGGVG